MTTAFIASGWRAFSKGTLVGFVDLQLPSGLILKGCTYHRQNERCWVGLPGAPQLDRTGKVLIAPKTGKVSYVATVAIPDVGRREAFQQLAIEAIERLIGSSSGGPTRSTAFRPTRPSLRLPEASAAAAGAVRA